MTVKFRRTRLWWMRQHAKSRLWMWCRDCRWAQEAWSSGEFYAHDEPEWHLDECIAHSTLVQTESEK
jgi:hypothetical protein